MTHAEAIAILERVQAVDPDALPCPAWAQRQPLAPKALAALAGLSFGLGHCQSPKDLFAAIDHGITLIRIGVIDVEDWCQQIGCPVPIMEDLE